MHALLFEMRPKPGHLPHYFAHVDRLRPILARHTGLLWLDRFRAVDDPDLILSHQHWADEAAILGWRRDPQHRRSQEAGRRVHFEDYRIRVGRAMGGGADAAGFVTVHAAAPAALPGARAFESLNTPGAVLTLADAADAATARALLDAAQGTPGLRAAHAFALSRDYGLTQREQAPA
ncbi:MAG: antibiotic biosynthesis monooxygenase family protein [Alkalilacustris sp.]